MHLDTQIFLTKFHNNSYFLLCCQYCHIPTFIALFTCTGAPQVVTVTPVNSTTVNVSWSKVQCFNGSGTVTHYLVQYWSICGGAVQNVTTSGTIQTFSGLISNYVYTFRVAAVGASQKIGPFSNPANTVPPGELYRTQSN